MAAPRIRLTQTLWYLSRPWPHLGGLRELVVRAAFGFESDSPAAPAKKVVEGCSVMAMGAGVDEAQLVAALDGAEAMGLEMPMREVIPWRAALEHSPMAAIPARLLSWAAADAGLRILGLPMAQGFPQVWVLDARRGPEEPCAQWLSLEHAPDAQDAGEAVLPGVFLQQRLALALARGDGAVALGGPWAGALTHIPQRESGMMARMHGDLYLPGPGGPSVGAGAAGGIWAQTASVAQAVGFGCGQTVETHRRTGIGRLRGK